LAEAVRQLSTALDRVASIDETPATRREQMNPQVALATTRVHVKGHSYRHASGDDRPSACDFCDCRSL
jgi:hypothetical protein